MSSSNGDWSQTWYWFLFACEVSCAVAPPTKKTCSTEGDTTGLFLCEIIVEPFCVLQLRSDPKIVIAKMNAVANDVPLGYDVQG